ncbi:MAG: GTP-binding protein, partial [Candidatus Hodgkinia cicadicola]
MSEASAVNRRGGPNWIEVPSLTISQPLRRRFCFPSADVVPKMSAVAVVGHINHGKTSLLDELCGASFTAAEVGGITQRVRSCALKYKGCKLSLLDTPGHSAFAKARRITVQSADAALLLIDVTSGVKQQTEECLERLISSRCRTIVVYTKLDEAKLSEGFRELSEIRNALTAVGLPIENNGGLISEVQVSAKSNENLKLLLDMLRSTSEASRPHCDLACFASAIVLDAYFCPESCETSAVVLVSSGVLITNQLISVENHQATVRLEPNITFALASAVATVFGLPSEVYPGSFLRAEQTFNVSPNVLRDRRQQNFGSALTKVLVKADSLTSVQALRSLLRTRNVLVIGATLGAVTEATVAEANSFAATVVAFNTRTTSEAAEAASVKHVPIIQSQLIYDVEASLEALNAGKLLTKVAKLFGSQSPSAYGALLTSGELHVGQTVLIRRRAEASFNVNIKTLRRFGLNVPSVACGQSFGFTIESGRKL